PPPKIFAIEPLTCRILAYKNDAWTGGAHPKIFPYRSRGKRGSKGFAMSSYEPKDSDGNTVDPYHIRKYFEPLRVVDVVDALDGLGYFNIGLVSQEIRPLWLGMKFWGPAVTQRC